MFCQNDACPKASACLRHLALKLLTPDEREIVVLNPLAYPAKGAACPLFGSNETVLAAWGIVNLLTTVPYAKAQKIKAELLSSFGRSKYYRMRREEIPVMPEDQALIKEIFMKNGIETDPEYSRFTEEYQWSFHTDETHCFRQLKHSKCFSITKQSFQDQKSTGNIFPNNRGSNNILPMRPSTKFNNKRTLF